MTAQFFYWILGIAGTIIIFLLGIVGYFLKQNYLSNTILTKTVTQLDKTLSVVSALFQEVKDVTKERLDCHAKQLDEHEVAISVLKSKVK